MTTTLAALYDDVRTAQRVVNELHDRGFNRNNVSLVARDVDEQYAGHVDSDYDAYRTDDSAAEGAGIGAVIGGIGGLLVGLGTLAIPGVGPVIVAGEIAAALAGAGVGALAGGIVGAMVDAGLPENDAHYYAEGVRRGATLVAVQVADDRVDEAADIMERFRPVDLNERAEQWRQEGWTRFDESADPWTRDQIGAEYERHGIEHPDFTAHTRDGALIHDIVNEESEQRTTRADNDFDRYDQDFRRHYETTYTDTDDSYETIQPAYRYGHELGRNERFRNRDWNDIEPEARTDWMNRHEQTHGAWEDVSPAIRHSWDRARTGVGDRDHLADESGWRRHYDTTYANTDYRYAQVQPAYQFGSELGVDDRYRRREWSDIEPEARNQWRARYGDNESSWDDVKDAVRHGWHSVRQRV